jgi:thiamine biosynthesis lipoprotein
VNEQWHAWQPSTLTNINQAIAKGEPIAVTEDIAAVIKQASDYAKQSKNLFNPAAGKLFELWGYHQDNWFESHPPPAQAELDQWLDAAPSMADVHIKNGMLTSTNPMVKIGFGAFAKGTAVDAAIEALKQYGIQNAIINIGGDLRAIGKHGDRPWMIGIRHPRTEGKLLASVQVEGDESVFTSGDYERFFIYEGKRYPHIIDPRTGQPARDAISVTVLSDNAAKADAAATALVVAGQDWPSIAASMGIDAVMAVMANGEVQLSPAMESRVNLLDNSLTHIVRDIPEQTDIEVQDESNLIR